MKKYLVAAAAGMAFLPLLGLWVLSKIYDILEQYEAEPLDYSDWTAEEWALWWGEDG